MQTIRINSLPLQTTMEDIGKAFSVPCTEDCDEYYVAVPKKLGEGYIRGIAFDGGLGLMVYECVFLEPLQIEFILNEVHPLKFLYVTEGILRHKFENDETIHEIDPYQSAIVASHNGNGHVLQFQANVKQCVYSVEIDRTAFKEKMECDLHNVRAKLKKVFEDVKAETPFYHNGNYSLQIANLFDEMQDYKEERFIRRLFLEGMTYQILAQQILQYQDDIKDPGVRSLLRGSELEMVRKAAFIIENNIAEPHTVEQLSKEVGLNINKLQEGFKNLFHLTVNSYMQRVRLNVANNLLLNTDYSISEIVNIIGLSSKSYFSRVFKEAYDISPSQLRKKNKKISNRK